jgi:molecular chaperone HscB
MDDYFAVFGLPRTLVIDDAELRRRYYALSREHHRDVHQVAGATAEAAALARSALVNRAYRALRDPLVRVETLIALEEGKPPEGGTGGAGRDAREGVPAKPRAPRALLAEIMDIQEALQDASADGLDEAARDRLRHERARLQARYDEEATAMMGRLPEWDGAGAESRRALLEWFRERLATRAYLRTVIGDLADSLGEDREVSAAPLKGERAG